MRPISSTSRAIAAVLAIVAGVILTPTASAQIANTGYQYPYSYSNQNSYSYGLQLPQVPQPNGQDEIRAADGTTCRSSMASNNAYVDVGAIGGANGNGEFDSGTVYGRLIIPLGDIPKRLDCSSLYNLEIERLKGEIALMRAGLSGGVASASVPGQKDKAWAERGWSNGGSKDSAKTVATNDTAKSAKKNPAPAPIVSKTIVPMHLTGTGADRDNSKIAAEHLPWSDEPAKIWRN